MSPPREEASQVGNQDKTVLYIGGLPKEVRAMDLDRLFSPFGKLKSTEVVKDPFLNESRGFGFVVFENSQDAENAQKGLDYTKVDGKTISVAFSRRCKPREPTPGKYLGHTRNKVDPNPENHHHHRMKRSRSRELHSRERRHHSSRNPHYRRNSNDRKGRRHESREYDGGRNKHDRRPSSSSSPRRGESSHDSKRNNMKYEASRR